MENEQTAKSATQEVDINYWRNEIEQIRAEHPDEWRNLARIGDAELRTGEGERIIRSVADGRGSIARTCMVVMAIRAALSKRNSKLAHT